MSDLPTETPEEPLETPEEPLETPDEPLETPDEPLEEKPKKRKGYKKNGEPRKPLTEEHLNQLKIARELALKKRQEICRKKQEIIKKEESYEDKINKRIERLALKEKLWDDMGKTPEPVEETQKEPPPSLPLPIPLKRTTSIFMKGNDGHFYF